LANAVPTRVEHAIATDPELARRLGDANIPVVAQPIFLTAFGHELNLVPVPRPLRLMPFRTQLEAGVPLVFSSDYPAAELNPWLGIRAAVTRLDEVGCPIHPEEAIELPKALDAYTRSGAKTLGMADAGSLEPGMRADIVWCDRDPHAMAPTQLAEIATLATWFEGRLVHTAASATGALGELRA
jgi:predicted amidohydrolase YtcJ